MTDFLHEGLLKLNFSQEEAETIAKKMELYINELRLFNSAYNLVNTDDHDEIVINHILDSLAPVAKLKELIAQLEEKKSRKIVAADIGSGGGLPGIPLAAAMPAQNFILVERMSKRCAFLENCAAILGLSNVTVLNTEAEKVENQSIELAVFRAFRPLDKKMTKTLLAMPTSDGFLAAYKAKTEKIQEEMAGIKELVPEYTTEPVYVPFLTDCKNKEQRQRNLVIICKNSH